MVATRYMQSSGIHSTNIDRNVASLGIGLGVLYTPQPLEPLAS